MFCPKCGNEVPEDAGFCGSCGNPVKQSPAQPAQPTDPTTFTGAAPSTSPAGAAAARKKPEIPIVVVAAVVVLVVIAIFTGGFGLFKSGSSKTVEIELTGMAAHADSWTVWDEASTGGTVQLYSSGNARLKISSDSKTIYCDWEIDSNGNVVLEDSSGDSITLRYSNSGNTETLSYSGYTFTLR